MNSNEGMVHTKALPYLSIVQSRVGSYGIQIDNSPVCHTGEGNFFIAPSVSTQRITHYLNKEKSLFEARFIFLDVIINKTYSFDDIFDLPITVTDEASEIFNKDFDDYENAGCVCEKMICIYNIIKHLIKISKMKDVYRNSEIYPLINFIRTNYADNITIPTMASILKMSESNLYAVFKKSTGVSPIKYLNEYRLSLAAELLLNTDLSVKSVSEAVGIQDQFYFSRLFKAKYFVPPQKYRKERY